MDEARARTVLHEVIAGEELARAIAERMLILELRELRAVEAAQDLVIRPATLLRDGREQHRGDDEALFAREHEGVVERGVVGDSEVRRQRPRRGRPDDDVHAGLADDRELHVNALADVVGVFDLRLGERSAARDAPIHRLLAAIDEALLHDVREQAEFVRLVFLAERDVRIFPVAKHAEALELRALDVEILERIRLARLANRGGVGAGVAGLAHLLRDLEFDGQTVAIPARDVGRVFAADRLMLDDDVLEDLVQRGADMDVAIGERRAVVQDEFLLAGAGFLNLAVEIGGLPFLQALRFARHQIGFHGKVGARQIERVFVVHRQSFKGGGCYEARDGEASAGNMFDLQRNAMQSIQRRIGMLAASAGKCHNIGSFS